MSDICPKCGGETRPRWEEYAKRLGVWGPAAMLGTLYQQCQECGFRWPVRPIDELKEG